MNSSIGVILAGGLATRLHNKPILPMLDGRPIICSAIDYLQDCQMDSIIILDQQRSILPALLPLHTPMDNLIFVKDSFDGVVVCLLELAESLPDVERFTVLCADNIYPVTEYDYEPDTALCRYVSREALEGLVTYSNGWYEAGDHNCNLALTTPWHLETRTILDTGVSANNVPGWFNQMGIKPCKVELEDWADLGTEANFRRYWNV